MSFIGKEYAFVGQENFEALVNSWGLDEAKTKSYLDYHPNQKLVQTGDSYTMVMADKQVVFKSGVPFQDTVSGLQCTTTYTLEGNTLKQVQKYDDGTEVTYTRVYSDNELVVAITTNKFDGQAYRYYKAV